MPITKEVVRSQVVAMLGRGQRTIIYDVGAGTGSVAVELALANPLSTIYAFEINPEACDLISQNKEKFGTYNLVLVSGKAPQSLLDIPPPTKVFIGGTKGNLGDIVDVVLGKNKNCHMVVSAIAVETFSRAIDIFATRQIPNMEVTQLAVSKTKAVGNYHMLMGQNPIFLISGGQE